MMDRIPDLSERPYLVEAGISAVYLVAFGLFAVLDMDWASYDMYNHMLFARHYAEHWFTTFIPHVGGGLDISTYPPLVFQAMAAVSFAGLPFGIIYRIFSAVAPAILGYSVYLYVREVLDLPDHPYRYLVPVAVAFSPAVLKSVFAFGQLTTIFGLAAGFYALYLHHQHLTGARRDPLLLALAVSVTAFTHHFSALLLLIALAVTTAYHWRRAVAPDRFPVLAGAGTAAAVLAGVGLLPAVTTLLSGAAGHAPIPHGSRTPLQSRYMFDLFLLTSYGAAVFGILHPVFRERGREVLLIALSFAALGLGFVTPFPELLFGGAADILTYGRFTFVASVLLAALAVDVIVPEIGDRRLALLVAVLYVGSGFAGAFYAHDLVFGTPVSGTHTAEERADTLDFLESVPADHRYQTFGYGPPIGDVYFYTDVPTLDTVYFAGRTQGWLRDSGIGEVDRAGSRVFDLVLEHADDVSLGYILTYEDSYRRRMEDTGWERIGETDSFTAWAPPTSPPPVEMERPRVYTMTVIPPLAFLAFAALLWRRVVA